MKMHQLHLERLQLLELVKNKNQIYDGVEELEAFCRTMRQSLNSNVIVGG